MTSSADLNPYAPPAEVATDSKLKTCRTLNASRIFKWLMAAAMLQVAMTVLTVSYIRQPILGLPIESPYVHLTITIAVALWATFHLTRRYPIVRAISVALTVNGVQWAVFVATAVLLKETGFTHVGVTRKDTQIFLSIWAVSSLVLLVVCAVSKPRIRKT